MQVSGSHVAGWILPWPEAAALRKEKSEKSHTQQGIIKEATTYPNTGRVENGYHPLTALNENIRWPVQISKSQNAAAYTRNGLLRLIRGNTLGLDGWIGEQLP
jgi:hypothetical protein